MLSLSNKLFVFIVAVALFMPLGYRIGDAVVPGMSMPGESDLEGRTYQEKPELSAETVSSGTFQDDMEQMVADSVPKRKGVLVTNAALQRRLIEIANAPFGFEVYPTFYGSETAWDPSLRATMQIPQTKESTREEDLRGIRAAASVMDGHPEINWAFYLPERSNISTVSPALALTRGSADYPYFENLLAESLPSSCNVISDEYASAEEYYRCYFRTDHHWQAEGGMRAYRKICDAFGKTPADCGDLFTAYEGAFYGSNDRNGLVTAAHDTVDDIAYDTSNLFIWIDGEPADASSLDEMYSGKEFRKSSRYANVYAEYFHGDYGLITIVNPDAPNGTLLVIGDSYTNCMERLLAANYRTVYVIDPRHYEGDLSSFMDKHTVDDGLFLMCTTNLEKGNVADFLES